MPYKDDPSLTPEAIRDKNIGVQGATEGQIRAGEKWLKQNGRQVNGDWYEVGGALYNQQQLLKNVKHPLTTRNYVLGGGDGIYSSYYGQYLLPTLYNPEAADDKGGYTWQDINGETYPVIGNIVMGGVMYINSTHF